MFFFKLESGVPTWPVRSPTQPESGSDVNVRSKGDRTFRKERRTVLKHTVSGGTSSQEIPLKTVDFMGKRRVSLVGGETRVPTTEVEKKILWKMWHSINKHTHVLIELGLSSVEDDKKKYGLWLEPPPLYSVLHYSQLITLLTDLVRYILNHTLWFFLP